MPKEEFMKKLNGYLHLYPDSQTDIDALTEYDSECKTYHFIAGLLGLPFVPEKWAKVCAYDADCNDESSSWHRNGYTVEGSPGILPFPDYLPADLLRGKKENAILNFCYGDMDVSLTLKQLNCDPYNQPCDNTHETDTAVSFLQPPQKIHTEPTEQKNRIMPFFVPIILAASGFAGIFGIVAASVVTAGILKMSARNEG
jgi:hypothetical protein